MVVGKKSLKDYEFKSLEDYFNYIVDSQINGNNKQVKELHDKLNKDQKKQFYNYIQSEFIKFDYSRVL